MKRNSSSDIIAGNLACLGAYLIFGFNLVCCKNISNFGGISPIALFCMRSAGALLLFWILSLFFHKKERIRNRDIWKVALASFLGLFLTQFSFLKAITMTTAVDASLLSLLSPIMTMIVAAVVIKDKITAPGVIGLSISLAGVLFLVLNGVSLRAGADHTSVGGMLLMIVNTLSFAIYVGVFKPLIKRYSVITFMKWMFLFSTVFALPFGIEDLVSIDYSAIPIDILLQLLFVVICATFIAYFLIPVGQKKLRPVVVCMYSYVQPVIAMGISLAIGLDHMTWQKGVATLFIFAGVSIVNFSKHKPKKLKTSYSPS